MPRPLAAPAIDRNMLLPGLGLLVLAVIAFGVSPRIQFLSIAGLIGASIVSARPLWGVAVLMITQMVQYGRAYEGASWVAEFLPAGSGYLTVNNVLGLFLVVLLAYRVYRDQDWSFLRNRQVQLIGVITLALALSALVNPLDYHMLEELGVKVPKASPLRLLVTRGAFVLLFVAFVRDIRDVRTMVMIYMILALITAYQGTSGALTGTAFRPHTAEYRAGGRGLLIEFATNPNRLAMVATLAIVFIWEIGRERVRPAVNWLVRGLLLFLGLTIFLTASRGGVVGLLATIVLLVVRERGRSSRLLTALATVLVGGFLVMQVVPAANIERLSTIPGISDDDTGEGAGSFRRRQYTMQVALDIAANNPVLGIGPGNWEPVRLTTDPERSGAVPHNSYLLALAEGGAVALFLYLLLFWVSIRALVELESDPEVMADAARHGCRWVISGVRISLMSFLVFALFSDLFELFFFYLMVALAAAVLQLYPRPGRAEFAR